MKDSKDLYLGMALLATAYYEQLEREQREEYGIDIGSKVRVFNPSGSSFIAEVCQIAMGRIFVKVIQKDGTLHQWPILIVDRNSIVMQFTTDLEQPTLQNPQQLQLFKS